MRNIAQKLLVAGICTFATCGIYAQELNPISTAMPSLLIAPDAKAGGMGDAGVATIADPYSQHWNPAKYAFSSNKAGGGLTYTPWLRKVINDIALMYVSGYHKLGNEDDLNQAISASVRYFSIGNVDVTTPEGKPFASFAPHEMAIDLGYSRKLTQTFSGGVTVRYIRSDYSGIGTGSDLTAGSTFAADISGYNESFINVGQAEDMLGLGFNISNIGGKISNNGGNNSLFIPTNLRLGAGFTHCLDEMNTLLFSLDINKLLVPTPPVKGDKTQDEYNTELEKYRSTGSIAGIFKSFGDAPGGFAEEMREISYSAGVEYAYDQKFKVRAGYFHEDKTKGNRQYFTFGAGFRMNIIRIDAAYLMSTATQNPLDQTLRLSIGVEI